MKTVYFLFLLIFFSCGNAQTGKGSDSLLGNDTLSIYGVTISPVAVEKEQLDLKEIKDLLIQKYFGSNVPLKVEVQEKIENISVYVVEVLGDLPTSSTKIYAFIDDGHLNLQFLLPIEFNQFFSIDNKKMFGGIYSYREFDYYLIYELRGGHMKLTLDTRDVNGNQIKVGFYKDDECIDYVPDKLMMKYNKRKNEIRFEGLVKIYCEGRKDRVIMDKPIKETSIQAIFDYSQNNWNYNKMSSYVFW